MSEGIEGEPSFQRELERRVFHLKTLYEVGQVIGPLREPRQIAKNLLLMVMGVFGATRGIVLLIDEQANAPELLAHRGFEKALGSFLAQSWDSAPWPSQKGVGDIVLFQPDTTDVQKSETRSLWDRLAAYHLHVWIPFAVNDQIQGGIGLGGKLSGEAYTPDDQELCGTLTQQLIVSLDNALAYRAIEELNRGLEEKVRQRTEALRLEHEKLKDVHHQLELRNQFIRTAFGRYVSDEVVVKLLERPEGLNLGGEKRHLTILMSDLRGFTSLAEKLTPEQMLTIVNRYLGSMVDVILRHQGTINEFLGDAILVLFGAPVSRADDARRAVACALSMQQAMSEVNLHNQHDGLPEVEMGIGIHSGEVVVGNIGSHRRTKYGVVGNTVNLASRIESFTIGGQILISEDTRREVGSILQTGQHFEVEAKGITQPLRLHEVRGLSGNYNLFLPRQEEESLPLQQRITVRYSLVEEKHLSRTVFEGYLVRLSTKSGEIYTEDLAPLMSNIRIRLCANDGEELLENLYGKVLRHLAGSDKGFLVHFTSPLPETVLVKLLSSGETQYKHKMNLSKESWWNKKA